MYLVIIFLTLVSSILAGLFGTYIKYNFLSKLSLLSIISSMFLSFYIFYEVVFYSLNALEDSVMQFLELVKNMHTYNEVLLMQPFWSIISKTDATLSFKNGDVINAMDYYKVHSKDLGTAFDIVILCSEKLLKNQSQDNVNAFLGSLENYGNIFYRELVVMNVLYQDLSEQQKLECKGVNLDKQYIQAYSLYETLINSLDSIK